MLGSVAILTGFMPLQRGRISTDSYPYLLLNAVGAIALCSECGSEHTPVGFVLIEAV